MARPGSAREALILKRDRLLDRKARLQADLADVTSEVQAVQQALAGLTASQETTLAELMVLGVIEAKD